VSSSHFFFLLTTLFLLYSILSLSSSEAKHFLHDVIFASIKCFIQSSYIFKYFLLFLLFNILTFECC